MEEVAWGAGVDVSVILVNYNTAVLLPECLSRLEAACDRLRVQVLIVDNASKDGSAQVLDRYRERYEVIENAANVGFGRANNQVIDRLSGRYVLLLNVDAFVQGDTLKKTIEYMDANPACGVLGVRLVGREGDLQPSCRYFPTPWNGFLNQTGLGRFFPGTRMVDDMDWAHDSNRNCDWVPGCYYLVRREVISSLGLFDPRFFVYYEEVDHCYRVRQAGWRVTYFSGTEVVHIGGESAKSAGQLGAGRQLSALQMESELLYFRKHHGLGGAAVAVVLNAVGNGILALKAIWRMPKGAALRTSLRSLWDHTVAYGRTFLRTGAGRRATR